MMKEPEQKVYIGTYKSYLLYKHTIDSLRKKDGSIRDVATDLDVNPHNLWGVFRALVKYKVIKRVRYSNGGGHKRAVYRLVKNE